MATKRNKMNKLQVLLINYCTDLYVGYQKQAFLELFPIPNEKKTSREQMFVERLDFLNKENKTRVNEIANLSDAEAKAYLEKIIHNLEKQRGLAVEEEVKAETPKAKAKVPKAKERGEEYDIKFE